MAEAKKTTPKAHTVINGNFLHDGVRYKEGEQVEIEPEQAARYIEQGILVEGVKKPAAPAKVETPKEGTK